MSADNLRKSYAVVGSGEGTRIIALPSGGSATSFIAPDSLAHIGFNMQDSTTSDFDEVPDLPTRFRSSSSFNAGTPAGRQASIRMSEIMNAPPQRPNKEMGASFAAWTGADKEAWICAVCTYVNQSIHLACDVCGTTRPTQEAEDDQQVTITDFDGSLNSAQAFMVAEQNRQLAKAEQRVLERERMDEFIRDQESRIKEIQEKVTKQKAAEANKEEAARLRSQLQECLERLDRLEIVHEEEKEEQKEVFDRQVKRNDLRGRRDSKEALEWNGQQRLLDEWQASWHDRQSLLEKIRKQQQSLLNTLHSKSTM